MSGPVIDGNDPVTGHIISTTIGGKNGEPKQVNIHVNPISLTFYFPHVYAIKYRDLNFHVAGQQSICFYTNLFICFFLIL